MWARPAQHDRSERRGWEGAKEAIRDNASKTARVNPDATQTQGERHNQTDWLQTRELAVIPESRAYISDTTDSGYPSIVQHFFRKARRDLAEGILASCCGGPRHGRPVGSHNIGANDSVRGSRISNQSVFRALNALQMARRRGGEATDTQPIAVAEPSQTWINHAPRALVPSV